MKKLFGILLIGLFFVLPLAGDWYWNKYTGKLDYYERSTASPWFTTVYLYDLDMSNKLAISWPENDVADRLLRFYVNGGSRQISLAGNFTLSGNNTVALWNADDLIVKSPWADVRAYGATGNGITDDRLAIQAAIDAINVAGGGIVFFPKGTYLVSEAIHPANASYGACLIVYANITLEGAGINATIIKRAANGTIIDGLSAVIFNRYISIAGTDRDINIRNLTVDGNCLNQTVNKQTGVFFKDVRSLRLENVKVKNVKNTAVWATDSFCYETQNCTEVYFINCEATNDDGASWAVSGYHANNSNMVRYTNCIVNGNSVMRGGFGAYRAGNVQYVNCESYSVSYDHFHSEFSRDVLYTNCIGGGRTQAYSATPGYAADTNLGGAIYGLTVHESSDVIVQGVNVRYNTTGINITNGTTGVLIDGANVSNSTTGIRIPSGAGLNIVLKNITADSCTTELSIGAVGASFARDLKTWENFEHFIGLPDSASGIWIRATNGAGAYASPSAGTSLRPGILSLATGTTNAGYANITAGGSVTPASFLFGAGIYTIEDDIWINNLSDGTDTYVLRFGFGDLGTGTPVDGAYFYYTDIGGGGATPNWYRNTVSNSVLTSTDTGVAVVAGSWIRLKAVVNSDATSVEYFINGTSVGSNVANIPSGAGRGTGAIYSIIKTAGTTSRVANIDWAWLRIELTATI